MEAGGEGGYKAGNDSGVDTLFSHPTCFRVTEVKCDTDGIKLQNRNNFLAKKGDCSCRSEFLIDLLDWVGMEISKAEKNGGVITTKCICAYAHIPAYLRPLQYLKSS